MIVVGVLVVLHPDRLTDQLDLFTDPSFKDIVYAAVVAMLAYAGIEAASDLAPDIDVEPRDLKRIVSVGAFAVPLVYAGMAAIALMAVPVVAGPHGPETALGGQFVEEPVLGVVSAFHPAWVADTMRWMVALVAAPGPLLGRRRRRCSASPATSTRWRSTARSRAGWASSTRRHATPHVAIAISRPDRDRPGDRRPTSSCWPASTPSARPWRSRSPTSRSSACGSPNPTARARSGCRWNVRWRGAELPLPAIVAAVLSGLAFLSVLAYHDTARWVGGGWMVFGLLFYVVYRKVFEGTTLTKRVSVTEQALTKQVPEVDFRNILVPVFGTKLDDDIVSTAGRLAAAEQEEAGGDGDDARLDVVYVIEVPLTAAARRRAAARARGGGAAGARAGPRGRRGVRGRRGQHRGDPRPQGRRRASSRRRGAATPRRS